MTRRRDRVIKYRLQMLEKGSDSTNPGAFHLSSVNNNLPSITYYLTAPNLFL